MRSPPTPVAREQVAERHALALREFGDPHGVAIGELLGAVENRPPRRPGVMLVVSRAAARASSSRAPRDRRTLSVV